MSGAKEPGIGPVMAFTAKRAEVVRFYTEIAGLKGDVQGEATWLAAGNAQLVVHDPDGRPSDVRRTRDRGMVRLDDVATAFAATGPPAALSGVPGDYFFARDPDGRYVGFHANEEHGHGHDHDH